MYKKQKNKIFSYTYFIATLLFILFFMTLDYTMIVLQGLGLSSLISFLGPNQDKILRVLIGVCILIIFVLHFHFTMKKQRQAELYNKAKTSRTV